MPSASRDPERAWFVWKHFHPSEADDPRSAFVEGFRRGYRGAVFAQTPWADLPQRVDELNTLLRELLLEREIAATDTRSPPWSR
jgi:hypothetical protein